MNSTAAESEVSESPEEHIIGITSDGVNISYWRTARLWELAASLPVETFPLSSLTHLLELDQTQSVSNRELGLKVGRILQADLNYPIILSAKGWLWDGWHRLMKAFALGLTEIQVVRFSQDPAPDYRKRLDFPADETDSPTGSH